MLHRDDHDDDDNDDGDHDDHDDDLHQGETSGAREPERRVFYTRCYKTPIQGTRAGLGIMREQDTSLKGVLFSVHERTKISSISVRPLRSREGLRIKHQTSNVENKRIEN